MRIGVFGGAFDPVHYGHLILAEQCREQARLDQVRFVPTAHPPHKQAGAVSPFERRAAMRAELPRRLPDNELFLLTGSDVLPDLPHWHEPRRVVARAGLVVMERPGWPVLSAEALRAALGLPAEAALWLERVDVPLIDL